MDRFLAPPRRHMTSLWRQRDFMLLWCGQTISELGSAVTMLALPLTAVALLQASPFQIGLLNAATTAAFLVIALPAGVLVDRRRKRGIMLWCDAARLAIIASVPLAARAGVLTLGQLYAVALAVGICTVFFDVAYQSYLPVLIGRQQLYDGNGKLGTSQSFAQVAGPGLGGALVGLLGVAGALSADAISYAASVGSLLLIRTREQPATARPADRTRLRTELAEGLRFVSRDPILRQIVACTATVNLFAAMTSAVRIIFLVRLLHISLAATGLLTALAALAGVAAGMLSGKLTRLIGSARIIWFSLLVFGVPDLLVPLAEPGWRIALVVVGQAAVYFSSVLYNVSQISYRQSVCPPDLLGRINATVRWIVWGTLPLGAVLGGLFGSVIGVRATLWIGFCGCWAAGLLVFFSPLRAMRDILTSHLHGGSLVPDEGAQQALGGQMAKRVFYTVARWAGVKARPLPYHWT